MSGGPISLLLTLAIAGSALAQLLIDQQYGLLQRAIDKAAEAKAGCTFAIVEEGSLVSLVRNNDAEPGLVALAIARAHAGEDWTFMKGASEISEPGSPYLNAEVFGYQFTMGSRPISSNTSAVMGGMGIACSIHAPEAMAEAIVQNVFNISSPSIPEQDDLKIKQEKGAVSGALPLYEAFQIAKAALLEAKSERRKISVAVLDVGGWPRVILSDPYAPSYAAVQAVSKAKSARFFNLPNGSEDLAGASDPTLGEAPAYGVQLTNFGLTTAPGGILLKRNQSSSAVDLSEVVGAIGIAGSGYSEEDTMIDKLIANTSAMAINLSESIPPLSLRQRRGISAGEAQFVVKTIIEARKAEGSEATPGVVAVLDPMGTVRSFHVEDGCERGAPDIALKAALASSLFGVPSALIGNLSRANGSLYGIELLELADGGLFASGTLKLNGIVSFESGLPIFDSNNVLIGAVAVSGTGAGKGTANDGILAAKGKKAVEDAISKGRVLKLTPVIPPDLNTPSPIPGEILSLSQAVGLIDAVTTAANISGSACCVTTLDASLRVKAEVCMDDAFLGAANLSPLKAKTGHLFGKNNDELQPAQMSSGPLWRVEVTNGILFANAGGKTFKDQNNHTVASVGVAGAPDDGVAAQPAVDAWIPPPTPKFPSNELKAKNIKRSLSHNILAVGIAASSCVTLIILFVLHRSMTKRRRTYNQYVELK